MYITDVVQTSLWYMNIYTPPTLYYTDAGLMVFLMTRVVHVSSEPLHSSAQAIIRT